MIQLYYVPVSSVVRPQGLCALSTDSISDHVFLTRAMLNCNLVILDSHDLSGQSFAYQFARLQKGQGHVVGSVDYPSAPEEAVIF